MSNTYFSISSTLRIRLWKPHIRVSRICSHSGWSVGNIGNNGIHIFLLLNQRGTGLISFLFGCIEIMFVLIPVCTAQGWPNIVTDRMLRLLCWTVVGRWFLSHDVRNSNSSYPSSNNKAQPYIVFLLFRFGCMSRNSVLPMEFVS